MGWGWIGLDWEGFLGGVVDWFGEEGVGGLGKEIFERG